MLHFPTCCKYRRSLKYHSHHVPHCHRFLKYLNWVGSYNWADFPNWTDPKTGPISLNKFLRNGKFVAVSWKKQIQNDILVWFTGSLKHPISHFLYSSVTSQMVSKSNQKPSAIVSFDFRQVFFFFFFFFENLDFIKTPLSSIVSAMFVVLRFT